MARWLSQYLLHAHTLDAPPYTNQTGETASTPVGGNPHTLSNEAGSTAASIRVLLKAQNGLGPANQDLMPEI